MEDKKHYVGIKSFLFNDQKQILLLKRNLTHSPTLFNIWDLPGGKMSSVGTPEQNLERELREELGLEPTDYTLGKLIGGGITPVEKALGTENYGLVLFYYHCQLKNSKITIKLSEEHDSYEWKPLNEAKKLLRYSEYPALLLQI